MRVKKHSKIFNARLLEETIQTKDGEILAVPGDWLVCHEHGENSLWKGYAFKVKFESINGPNPNQLSRQASSSYLVEASRSSLQPTVVK